MNSQEQIQFLELPDPLGIHIVSYLSVSSYLNFRRVSRKSKTWADELGMTSASLKNHSIDWSSNWIVKIKEDEEDDYGPTIQQYMNSALLISNFQFVNNLNNAHKMFQNPSLPSFLSKFAQRIVRLTVHGFNGCEIPAEYEFYENLPSLRDLEIGVMSIGGHKYNGPLRPVPSTFRNLVQLKIHNYAVARVSDFDYLFQVFSHCQNLSKLIIPRVMNDLQMMSFGHGYENSLVGKLEAVILDREKKKMVKGEFPCKMITEIIDVEQLDDHGSAMRIFMQFCNRRDIDLI